MHISEGILSLPVLAAAGAVTAAGVALSLKTLNENLIPKTALLTAAFFLAGLIHVPIGPANMHLSLIGLMGLLLGPGAFIAVFTALLLQALLLQFGGITTLGVNTLIMGLPAVAAGLAFGRLATQGGKTAALAAFGAGALGVLGAAILAAAVLWQEGEALITAAKAVVLAHLPLAAVEGVITLLIAAFLLKNSPGLLGRSRAV